MSVSEDVHEARRIDGASFVAPAALSSVERRMRLAYLLSGACIIALIFFYLQYSTKAICCGDFDGYYHFKWARMLWENFSSGRFLPEFNALPLTTLDARGYVDHHFLFHVLQIPFTWISNDQHTGAKISAWLFSTLAVFACFWIVVRYRLRFTLLWLLALIASSHTFLYRMSMTKAMSLSLALLIVGLVLLFEGKHKWLGVLSFIYVWTYSLWFLLPIAVVIWVGVMLWSERRVAWQPVVWCAVGCLAGLIINPYFPHNIRLFYEHAAMKISPSGYPTSVGVEWYPYNTLEFTGNAVIACVAMLVGYIAFNWRDQKQAQRPLFFLIFSTLLMMMTIYARRYMEYFPPFAVLFAAFTLQTLFTSRRDDAAQLPPEVLDELQPYLDRDVRVEDEAATTGARSREDEATVFGFMLALLASFPILRLALPKPVEFGIAATVIVAGLLGYYFLRRTRLIILFVAGIALGFALFFTVQLTAKDIADQNGNYTFRSTPERFRDAMTWVKANVPKGEMIFNTNWDHFPKLFFESSDHSYTSGLDPNYLLDQNRELAELYDRIRMGKEENAAQLIRERFGARYIFTDQKKRAEDFFFNIMRSGWVEEVYDDEFATILRIRDERGDVPSEYIDGDDTPDDAQANEDEAGDAMDEDDNAPENNPSPESLNDR